jgi:hypothetical protein
MVRSGCPKAELVLSDVERETLLRWSRRAKTSQALALRSKIVPACAEGAACEDTHWSTRSMARSTGMSQTAISRIWRAFGLRPHLVDTWRSSKDPQFIEKVRDGVWSSRGLA